MDKKHPHRTRINLRALLPKILLIGIVQFGIVATAHSTFPPDYTATYHVDKFGTTVGLSTITLKQAENEVHYSQNVELVGFVSWFKKDRVSENSWLTKNENNIYLLKKYQYIHTHSKKNRDSLIEADWTINKNNQLAGTIIGDVRGKNIALQTNERVWDTLSFQLALMSDVSNKTNNYHYNVISRGIIKKYSFTQTGEEVLEINDREYRTVILERHGGKKSTKIWLSTELHYVPILIENYKDDELDSTLTLDTITFNNIEKDNEISNE